MGQLTRFWKLPKEYEKFLLPFEEEFEKFIFERYHKNESPVLKFFYTLKPMIPRFLQIQMRRLRAQANRNKFPNWPVEPHLENLKRECLMNLPPNRKIPFVWFWPDDKNFAFCLTHDVEIEEGLRNIKKIIEIDKKYGLRSCFYFVPENYNVPESLIYNLKKENFEVGVHGLRHDGKLFNSYKIFQERIKKIKIYGIAWNATGFRSPSLLRNAEWMRELPFSYDSSFPDTDPYGPQPGGSLSIFPYFLGNLVEIPITLPQDHTLFVILRHKDITIWKKKIDWIEKMNGLALLIVHPDYMSNSKNLQMYEELLQYILQKEKVWCALPQEINLWWRQRDECNIITSENKPTIIGLTKNRTKIAYIKHENEKLTFY